MGCFLFPSLVVLHLLDVDVTFLCEPVGFWMPLCSVYIVIIVTELYSLANLMNVHVSIHVKLLKQGDFFSWHLQLCLADLLKSYNTERGTDLFWATSETDHVSCGQLKIEFEA